MFLPPEISRLTQLENLNLNRNQFVFLPNEIAQLSKLQRLLLSSNQFCVFPNVLFKLPQLKELWIDGNKLTFLPPQIAQMNQLTQFWPNNNPFTADKSDLQLIALYPFLLMIPFYNMYLHPKQLEALCNINGLALEFVPDSFKTKELVDIAIKQNPESKQFVPPKLTS